MRERDFRDVSVSSLVLLAVLERWGKEERESIREEKTAPRCCMHPRIHHSHNSILRDSHSTKINDSSSSWVVEMPGRLLGFCNVGMFSWGRL